MTDPVTSAAENALARHSLASLRDLAATLGSYIPEGGTSHEDWVRRIATVWNDPASAMRLAGGLPEATRNLLCVLAWGPNHRPIKTRELARIAKSLGFDPAETISTAIAFGAIVPIDLSSDSLAIAVRKNLLESGVADNISVVIWPSLLDRMPAPHYPQTAVRTLADSTIRPGTPVDMAEWAVRLIALWQSAMVNPLRRTQAGGLHKKDRDTLLRDPVLSEPPHEWPGGNSAWSEWFVDSLLAISVRLGLLSEEQDSLRAIPANFWAEDAIHFQERFARAVIASPFPASIAGTDVVDDGKFTGWLPVLLLADLGMQPDGEWVMLETMLDDFAAQFACDEQAPDPRIANEIPAMNDTVGVKTRSRKKTAPATSDRTDRTIAKILKFWVSGPAWIAGLTELGTTADGTAVVRATSLARFLLGHVAPPRTAAIDKALFLQPNLEGILYRQAVTGPNMARLATLLRFTGIGPVLQVRLDESWSRLMFGAGLSREDAESRLDEISAVELSRSVRETFRTWAGKSDRVRVHGAVTILEVQNAEDQAALLELTAHRGLKSFAVGDRLVAIEDSDAIPFDALRLLAQQDLTQKPAVCVRPIEDGTLLEIDTVRSDLALEPELVRFTRPFSDTHSHSPWAAASRLFRIDRETLAAARSSGVSEVWLDRFFERRTGEKTPAAIRLLWICGSPGGEASPGCVVRLKPTCVIRTESESILDGLISLEATATLIGERLGPTAAEVEPVHVEKLSEIARDLGIVLKS